MKIIRTINANVFPDDENPPILTIGQDVELVSVDLNPEMGSGICVTVRDLAGGLHEIDSIFVG